jgi:choline dehydrogenase
MSNTGKYENNNVGIKKFDYIIIGAGGSGAVLASILSYGGRFSVLLIEQGYNHNADPRVINAANVFVADSEPDITDTFVSARDPGLNNKREEITQGRGWGGSTAHNYLYAARPSQTFLHALESIFGPKFLVANSNEILRCLENYIPQPESAIDSSRGIGGPVTISQLPQGRTTLELGSTDIISPINNQAPSNGLAYELGRISNGFIATELIAPNDDYNAITSPETNINIRQQAFVKIDGTNFIRTFTGTAYLHTGVVNQLTGEGNQRYLMIASGTRVMEVLFDLGIHANTFRATGVRALVGDQCCEFKANCGVIISAGVIDSPALLMRSGVGPQNVLTKACVPPVIINENVGRHLIFHIGPYWHLTASSTYASNPSITGYVNIPGVISPIYPPPYPVGYNPERMYQFMVVPGVQSTPDISNVNILSWNLVPKSEGDVSIVSSDIFTQPLIHINAYSHPDDKILAREFSRRLANSVNATGELSWANGIDPSTLSDSALDAIIASDSFIGQGCGTCRMSSNPWNGVVNTDFKVFGTDNLYVCDMSVYPIMPDATTALASILLGYKLSNNILYPPIIP